MLARNEYVAFPDFLDLNNSKIEVNVDLNRTHFLDTSNLGASLFGSNRQLFNNIVITGNV